MSANPCAHGRGIYYTRIGSSIGNSEDNSDGGHITNCGPACQTVSLGRFMDSLACPRGGNISLQLEAGVIGRLASCSGQIGGWMDEWSGLADRRTDGSTG